MDNSNYLVFLRQQEILAPVGWFEDERRRGVRLLITVEASLKNFPADDELHKGLNYTDILDVIISLSSTEYRLLETLAAEISQKIHMLAPNLITSISVIIEKPDVPHQGYRAASCGVRLDKTYNHA